MIFRKINREQSRVLFETYFKDQAINNALFDDLDNNYLKIRRDLLGILNCCEETSQYKKDLYFAFAIYEYFNNLPGFNEAVAEDYDFWRYICIKVAPEIILIRHGMTAKYFFEQTNRMYIPVMWWYIHMSYQGDEYTTRNVLSELTTDYIMQLVDRKGRYGFYLEVSREIMRCLSLIPTKIRNHQENDKNLFRRIMIQNTAICDNYNLVVENSAREYVYKLFRACKVEVNKYEKSTESN